MQVFITYRRDCYDIENDRHDICDRMVIISYTTFSLNRIQKDICQYMKDDELVINVILMYDLQFFDDRITEEDMCNLSNAIEKWRSKKWYKKK